MSSIYKSPIEKYKMINDGKFLWNECDYYYISLRFSNPNYFHDRNNCIKCQKYFMILTPFEMKDKMIFEFKNEYSNIVGKMEYKRCKRLLPKELIEYIIDPYLRSIRNKRGSTYRTIH